MLRSALMCTLFAATPALADIEARFIEGAPKDRFVLVNMSDCATGPLTIAIDLSGSAGALIFDTTGRGAGVEVFQPFELVSGGDALKELPKITDGDTRVALQVANLEPSGTIMFTIDVDDTVSNRQITVNGSEIAGATLDLGEGAAPFSDMAVATAPLSRCTS